MIYSNSRPPKAMPAPKEIRTPLLSLLMILPLTNLTHAAEIPSEKNRSFPNSPHNLYNAPVCDASTLDNDLTNYYQLNCQKQKMPDTINFQIEPGVDLLGGLKEIIKKKENGEEAVRLTKNNQAESDNISDLKGLNDQFMTDLEVISNGEGELTDDEVYDILKKSEAREKFMESYEKKVEMNKDKEKIFKKVGIATRETLPPLLGVGVGTGAGFGGLYLISAAGLTIPIVGPVFAAAGFGVIAGLGTWAGLRGGVPESLEKIPRKTVEFFEDLFKQKEPITPEGIIDDFHLIVNEK